MGERARQVDDTRLRITEAAVGLHTSVGPSETSFAAVAEAAGVTRLTLYRHFATRDELFAACMTHWRAQHPPPDLARWRTIRSFERRLRTAVTELYRWYEENGDALYPVYRDVAFTPESTHRARRENIERMTGTILGPNVQARPLRAAVGHVLGFWTWRSLAVEEGCSLDTAADLAARFVLSARRTTPTRAASRARVSDARRPGGPSD